jgi:hypothetical protein
MFSPCTLLPSTNKTDCHDITEIFLKVALNTIKQTNINNCRVCRQLNFLLLLSFYLIIDYSFSDVAIQQITLIVQGHPTWMTYLEKSYLM